MKNSNNITNQRNMAEKLLTVLPKNCNCHTCINTKNHIENILGKEEYIKFFREKGLSN